MSIKFNGELKAWEDKTKEIKDLETTESVQLYLQALAERGKIEEKIKGKAKKIAVEANEGFESCYGHVRVKTSVDRPKEVFNLNDATDKDFGFLREHKALTIDVKKYRALKETNNCPIEHLCTYERGAVKTRITWEDE